MICVSIVSHGQVELTRRLFECMVKSPSPFVRQVIYTRNIAEGPLPPEARGIAGLKVIDNPVPRGFGSNHNAAFDLCTEDLFCVLNPDIEWARDPFDALVRRFDARRRSTGTARLGLVAPEVLSPSGQLENTARKLYTPAEMLAQAKQPQNLGPQADWLAGMFLLFSSKAFETIGGFDTRYFLYIEDVDVCSRLRLAGWSLEQVPGVQVVHHAQSTSHRSPRYARWHITGMLRYWTSGVFWRYRALLAAEADASEKTSRA